MRATRLLQTLFLVLSLVPAPAAAAAATITVLRLTQLSQRVGRVLHPRRGA